MKTSPTVPFACLLAALVFSIAGCDTDNETDSDSGSDVGTDTDTENTDVWTLTLHDCTGNRTDTLWVDDDGTIYVGCGTTVPEMGLYVSTDGGTTFAPPTTTPPAFFGSWRVMDVFRDPDGLLYVTGRDTGGGQRVVSASTSGTTWALEVVLNSDTASSDVGTYRIDSTGREFAEAGIGSQFYFKESATDPWMSGASNSILDMELLDDQLFAVGGTIATPPILLIENESTTEFDGFTTVQLSEPGSIGEFTGEMWGIDADSAGLVIGGVNQDDDAGMVYEVDPTNGTIRQTLDLRTLFPDARTWVRGVCRRGADLVAVGEFSALSDGLIITSDDAGATWTDITPALDSAIPPVHECQIVGGKLYVAGGGGTMLIRDF